MGISGLQSAVGYIAPLSWLWCGSGRPISVYEKGKATFFCRFDVRMSQTLPNQVPGLNNLKFRSTQVIILNRSLFNNWIVP